MIRYLFQAINHKLSVFKTVIIITLITITLSACQQEKTNIDSEDSAPQPLNIVTTTTMITDLLKNIGGSHIQVNGLMGSGVDPHLYKATEGDLRRLTSADAIFYNGLHLEGKLSDIFAKMDQSDRPVIALAPAIQKEQLISSKEFDNSHDPHIWFDTQLWRQCAIYVAEQLGIIDPENKANYQINLTRYLAELESLDQELSELVSQLPQEKRVLVTAHDAFNYFGRQHHFEVIGLQGISTASEAGIRDVQNLATLIVEKQVPAIFVESSVSVRNIEALKAAVQAKGFDTQIGGELFSDATGSAGTLEESYIGMYRHNMKTIVDAIQAKK